jgi:hypothetical protein
MTEANESCSAQSIAKRGDGRYVLPRPLLDALPVGLVLPVVGAGLSRNAELPAGRRMPDWSELAAAFMRDVSEVDPRGGPIEVISAYEFEHSRQSLIQRLRETLNVGVAKPGMAQRAFAQLPFDCVVTTNFDFLVEDAYRATERAVHVIARDQQLPTPAPRGAATLLKIHGDFANQDTMVATEADYDRFMATRPALTTYLSSLLITRVALLIGFSLEDPDWRQLLSFVRERVGSAQQPVYALQVEPKPATVRRFERRGVRVIALPGRSESDRVLAACFTQMGEHIAEHAMDRAIITDEAARVEMLAVPKAQRRICAFLIPEELLAYYRAEVFPLLREADVTPLTPYDVGAPGGPHAVVTAIVPNARAVIADLTTNDSSVRYQVAHVARATGLPIAVVLNESDPVPAEAQHGRAALLFLRNPVEAPARVRDWVNPMFAQPPDWRELLKNIANADPGTKVVGVFRALESGLRARYPSCVTLAELLEQASKAPAFEPELATRLEARLRVRDLALYGFVTPDAETVDSTVEDVKLALALVVLGDDDVALARAVQNVSPLGPTADANTLGQRLRERDELAAAEYWLRVGAEGGDIAALYNLGDLLADRGELEEARRWLENAATSGEPRARARLEALPT